jgi:hypothetical protein
LFNVQESVKLDGEERKKEDTELIKQMLMKIEANVPFNNVVRLGQRGEKNRPIRIKTTSVIDHLKVLKAANKLQKVGLKEIIISKDLTPLERVMWKRVVKLKKDKIEESRKKGEDVNWVIRSGRVVKGRNVTQD